jgi:predicted ATP-grasp superfamily ATP-dependent carboligase
LPCAATFVANGRTAVLLGLTQQLIGDQRLHARPFQYCGSIGPLPFGADLHTALARLGHALSKRFGLIGLFGVDGILRSDGARRASDQAAIIGATECNARDGGGECEGTFWPVEVNPRYTASAEVIELSLKLPLLQVHRDACEHGVLPSETDIERFTRSANSVIGKAILFAPSELRVPKLDQVVRGPRGWQTDRWSFSPIADIPAAGEIIDRGHPICTVFARSTSLDGCRNSLTGAACELYRRLAC